MQCHKIFRLFLLCTLISSTALLNAQSGVFINKGQAENGGVLGGVFIGLSSSITAYQPTTISGGAIGTPQLYWKDLVGIEQIGTTLTKTDSSGWGNAGATSATQIECFENGWVEYRVDNLQNIFAFGLSNSNTDAGFESIEYAMMLDAGQLRVYNYGQLKGNFGPVALNDLVRIERMGNILFYTKNNIVLLNHQVDPIEHLLTDIALYNQGAAVTILVNYAESFKSPLVFRNKGCYINIKTGTSLVVDGKITLENTGQFDNSGKINLKGNWNNNSETPAFVTPLSLRKDLVEFSGANQTIGGTRATVFNDVTVSGSGRKTISNESSPVFNGNLTIQTAGTGTIILVNQSKNPVPVSVKGNLTIPRGSILQNDGTGFSLINNLIIDGSCLGSGGLFFTGSNSQTISGVSVPVINNMNINKSGGNITLTTPLKIGSTLTLTKGILITDNIKILTINQGATVSGASDIAYVSGPVQKIGNTAFTFPLGDMTLSAGAYHPITITEPALASDAFTAEYKAAKQPFGEALQTDSLESISNCEYWTLNRNSGTSEVIPTLGWNSNSCNVDDFNNLTLAGWDGEQWKSLGNGGVTLDGNVGTLRGGWLLTLYPNLPILIARPRPRPNQSAPYYATLKRELDGGYYVVSNGMLKFKFDEEYNDTDDKLSFKIYNNRHNEVVNSINLPLAMQLSSDYGEGWHSLNILNCNITPNGYLGNGYYILEVQNEKREKWLLRFRNTNNVVIICKDNIGPR